MKRPWQVWLVFLACVAISAAAMVWLTQQALHADRKRRAAESETELEQRVSLALWRMDTELAPLVAEEVIRPPSAYRPVYADAHIAQQRQVTQQPQDDRQQQQEVAAQVPASRPVWVPSGLFTSPPPYVVLHFEARPDGTWHSPQIPELQAGPPSELGVSGDVLQQRAARLRLLADSVQLPKLIAELPNTPLPWVNTTAGDRLVRNTPPSENFDIEDEDSFGFFEGNKQNIEPKPSVTEAADETYVTKKGPPIGKSPKLSKIADFEQRGERYQTATKQSLMNLQQRANNAPPNSNMPSRQIAEDVTEDQVGVSRPVWFGDKLILARRVGGNGETVVQGCWLDWPQLKTRLLKEAADLLPDADLERANDLGEGDPSRMLAGLPVRLVTGEAPVWGEINPTLSWALWIGWGAVALAVLAAAALLHGVMTLSERRAAFVSSVTHELRTPLTTFRMYAEMLARGMVPDAAHRQEYFNTLHHEAERLTLLVENVLAYAQLERGRKPAAQDRVTLAKLMERIGPRLSQRAAQADMKCDLQLDEHAAGQEFTTDQSVVEQILFNLVDNAAKYARGSADRQIHVEASRNGGWVRLSVRDHGPGIQKRSWMRDTRAFHKTAEESAETAPGVGLGLALCRRLAEQLGGHLDVASTPGGGTTATLRLPVAEK